MHLRLLPLLALSLAPAACAAKSAPSTSAPTPTSARADAPVTLTYLGVAGWRLEDRGHALLIDPYVSRRAVRDDADVIEPDLPTIARYVPGPADVILVSHSHYDHLLDVPALAARTGAAVIGTESTRNVARAAGLPEGSLLVAHGGETFTRGPFEVRAIRGLHSLIGVPDEPIAPGVTLPMRAVDYHEGGTLQYLVRVEGKSVLFVSTANFVEAELQGLRPDVAVLAVGLREKVGDYSCRLMRALGQPRLVLPNHFDAHGRPLGPRQVGEDTPATLARFAEEIHGCAPDTKVLVPTHFAPIPLGT